MSAGAAPGTAAGRAAAAAVLAPRDPSAVGRGTSGAAPAARPSPFERPVFAAKPKPIQETLRELWELLKAYARQETVGPLKDLGRYVAYGLGGMALSGAGLVFLGLAGLRAMQSQTDLFEGAWSWVPYVIVVLAQGVVVGIALSRISKGQPSPLGGDDGRGAPGAGGRVP